MNTTPKEDIESICFADWLRLKHLPFTHIANESGLPRNVALRVGNKKRRMGVAKGFPDFLIFIPSVGTLAVEMKRVQGSKIAPEQREWIQTLNSVKGVQAEVCKGSQSAIDFVSRFL